MASCIELEDMECSTLNEISISPIFIPRLRIIAEEGLERLWKPEVLEAYVATVSFRCSRLVQKWTPLFTTACTSPVQAQAREDHSKESRNRHKFLSLVEEPSAIGSCFKDMALGELTTPSGRPCTKGYMGSTNFTRRMKKEKRTQN